MNESEAVNELMESWRGAGSIDAEVHYNYFGDRGVVDLVVEIDDDIYLYELKSESAVADATGANEIIRQFNRMREYYFKDEEHPKDYDTATYRLYFLPSEPVIDHLKGNLTLYNSLRGVEEENLGHKVRRESTEVRLYDGRTDMPITEDVLEDWVLLEVLEEEYPVAEYRKFYE